ncbi:MAG TPA: phosphoribosylformylglycinamidine synthase subunit PurL [Planctomycetaceae bacterium]|jgi:phosphoribosylformylglycinamidine synthase|nr:phosphoribosylformylglycinamidine synthase subunit PurL [Planctomycetaceae bacterium]
MLWEVVIRPTEDQPDREAERVLQEAQSFQAASIHDLQSARSFLIQTGADLGAGDQRAVERAAARLLVDSVVETWEVRPVSANGQHGSDTASERLRAINVLFKPGVTDNVGQSTKAALIDLGLTVDEVATCRKYWVNADAAESDLHKLADRVLANEAIEHVVWGRLHLEKLSLGSAYRFELVTVPIRGMSDAELAELSRGGQLYLSLREMQTVRDHFAGERRDPTDVELETIAQTWSEHCSHKTLGGRIHYRDESCELSFENLLKETIFAATRTIRERLGRDDWCVSVFKDNAGVIKFDDKNCVCFKVETHNHPSALEPYGGANTGLGGVIRDPLGTGLGARPVCNTDVFCFAPPDTPYESLPPGILHPRTVAKGVVAGVRDYGNRMGIPTVNGAIYFDPRYLGNPLVFCGNVALIPADKVEKRMRPGDLIVAVGGRTGRDGIHGATFSSGELTHESETTSGGAVQIGNAVTEKMLADVLLEARDRGLYTAITDCGAGGFSSAVGEMGAETGAEVWLDRAPLKYSGLSYTEIWISEAQERMIVAVRPDKWESFDALCRAEGVEATVLGRFTETGRLALKYHEQQVADLSMAFLHDGRPPVIREATYTPPAARPLEIPRKARFDDDLKAILGSLNVCSKEWVIRQYDHEVQSGSAIKPLVGVHSDGPSDAAIVRPDLRSLRGVVIACGMNPRYGDLDPYWMAASAIDEAVRNCVAVGADPARIAILDNFCWGNTERPEVLGSLVRAALACRDVAVAWSTPFISGKDSLNNEFSHLDSAGRRQTVAIPPSLLISALGQIDDVSDAVTMDTKEADNAIYLIGRTRNELGGSHFAKVNGLEGGDVPQVDLEFAPQIFRALHQAISRGLVRSCHDLSEGGLAAAAAEMAFAGGFGMDLDLSKLREASALDDPAVLLFSESNTRFLVEVPPGDCSRFESAFAGLPVVRLGIVSAHSRLIVTDPTHGTLLDSPLSELRHAWKAPLAWD